MCVSCLITCSKWWTELPSLRNKALSLAKTEIRWKQQLSISIGKMFLNLVKFEQHFGKDC
jgi:hypothetical protein